MPVLVRFCAPSTDALRQGGDGAGWLGSSAGGLRPAPCAVEVAADDDCSVFVNGQAIGRINGLEGDLAYGWSSSNGTSFTLTNIGWNLESSDTIYVVGHS